MKKFMMLAIAAMAFLAVSCQKEKDEELPTFTAHADNGGMKTDMVGNFIHWNNTDQVKVFGDFGYAIYGVSPRGDDPTWATLSPIENHGITGFLPYRLAWPREAQPTTLRCMSTSPPCAASATLRSPTSPCMARATIAMLPSATWADWLSW